MQFTLLSVLDYAGVATFAASGALMAAQKRQDVVTFIFFAAITGVGGGTLRDLLIGAPVFWVMDPGYVIVCTLVAVLVFLTRGRGVHEQTLLWLDAVGLCVYAVVGAAKALSLGVHPVICVVMGALTATFGGIIRDVLAGEPSIIMRPEIYVTAAALAAGSYVALGLIGVPLPVAAVVGAVAGFGLRAAALRWKLALPAYRKKTAL